MVNKKKKVAVLGGGMAALTAAYQLSQQDDYEIDIYQIGWRLGGKGASGRNTELGDRIEEHGLHVWLGFYDNAFSTLRKVYQELDRPADAPLSRMYSAGGKGSTPSGAPMDAFTPINWLNMLETTPDGTRKPWRVEFPQNDLEPGLHNEIISMWGYLELFLKWGIRDLAGDLFQPPGCMKIFKSVFKRKKQRQNFTDKFQHLVKPASDVEEVLRNRGVDTLPETDQREAALWHLAHHLHAGLGADVKDHTEKDHSVLVWLIKEAVNERWRRIKDTVETNDDERRLWSLSYLALSYFAGCLENRVLYKGYSHLNNLDLREWFYSIQLVKEPLANQLAIESAPMQALYDLAFHYEDGDTKKPRLAAGIAIEILSRMVMGYKGSILYFMNAGMGDTIFTPLYQVLKRRGVKFHFFHKVTELGLSDDKKSLKSVKISRQINLKKDQYDPLVDVKDLECWPNRPLFDQIVEGQALKDSGENLEHAWNSWTDTGGEITLDADNGDFDHVILGITLDALPEITKQLTQADEAKWGGMLNGIKTVQTQAMQLWFNGDAESLGVDKTRPVVGAYVEPLSSMTDFSHLLERENWDANGPKHLIYDCGVLEQKNNETQPAADKRVRDNVVDFINNDASLLWPKATSSINPTGLDWSALYAPENVSGEDRVDHQYLRANIDPTERYVLSLPNTVKYRIKTDESGFERLILTGTWIDLGFNIACIEAAVISGMQAARVLTGEPGHIVGETYKELL